MNTKYLFFIAFCLSQTMYYPQTIEVSDHAKPLFNAITEGSLDKVKDLIRTITAILEQRV